MHRHLSVCDRSNPLCVPKPWLPGVNKVFPNTLLTSYVIHRHTHVSTRIYCFIHILNCFYNYIYKD